MLQVHNPICDEKVMIDMLNRCACVIPVDCLTASSALSLLPLMLYPIEKERAG